MAKLKKFYNILTGEDDTTAEIRLYGEIVANRPRDWLTGEVDNAEMIVGAEFLEDLKKLKNKAEITVKLNSCGGDAFAGIAIHNALKGLQAKKKVIVEGIAASAASLIACAGDTVEVYAGSLFMLHSPLQFLFGWYNYDDLKQEADGIKACLKACAEIYAEKTGIDVETCKGFMIGKETWLTGKEAVEKGFADVLISDGEQPKVQLVAAGMNKFVACNGIRQRVADFDTLPEACKGLKVIAEEEENADARAAEAEKKQEKTADERKEVEEMDKINTIEELKAAFPSLVAEIETQAKAEATTAERARLQEIEAIEATVGDKELIAAAKYGAEACNAEKLAFMAIQKQAEQRKAQVAAIKDDITASGSDKVKTVPVSTAEQEAVDARQAAQKASLDKVVEAINKQQGKA